MEEMPPPRAAVQFTGEKAGGVVALRKETKILKNTHGS